MSKYQIFLSSRAERDYKKLSPRVKERITKEILKLETKRYPQQFKPLIGKKIAQFRLCLGDYRVLYDVYDEDKEILILRIGHRRDIYR